MLSLLLKPFCNIYFIYQPTPVIIMKTWLMPIGRAVTLQRKVDHLCVTTYSPRDGIVFKDTQEKKCQQRVCQHSGVVQTGQAGWIVLILQWKMVKFPGWSVLVIPLLVADTQELYL